METGEILTTRIEHLLENNFQMTEVQRQVLLGPLKREISQHFEDGDVSIISVGSCKYIVIDDKSCMYKDFPYWSYGVHSKPGHNTLLFGRFFIDKLEGRLMIGDDFHKMPCAITNSSSNLSIFYNTYVLLKDYSVITEVFKDPTVKNWEYLIVDFEDIIMVYNVEKCPLLGTTPPLGEFRFKEEIIIIRKSQVSLRELTVIAIDIYLEILSVKTGKRAYLTLPQFYTRIHLFLREGFKYNMYTNKLFATKHNHKLRSIEKLQCFVVSPAEAVYFEELERIDNLTNNETNLISFERAVCNRDFVENKYVNESSLARLPNGFKNLDNKTNTVDFSQSKEAGMRLYLSNGELKVRPIGLVPSMVLRVRNVRKMPRYLQPTAFTTIEIVSYQPKVPVYQSNSIESTRYFLSNGHGIPEGVVVWNEIFETKLCELRITRIVCKACKSIEGLTKSTTCYEDKMEFSMVLFTEDIAGRSRVFSNSLTNSNQINSERLLEVFRLVTGFYGIYSFHDQDQPDDTHNNQAHLNQVDDSYVFEYLLEKFVLYLNQRGLQRFSSMVKCRKESHLKPNFKPMPNWTLLDVRTANN